MTAGGNSVKNATAYKVNSYYTLAISYCTFCVGKHTILGPESMSYFQWFFCCFSYLGGLVSACQSSMSLSAQCHVFYLCCLT